MDVNSSPLCESLLSSRDDTVLSQPPKLTENSSHVNTKMEFVELNDALNDNVDLNVLLASSTPSKSKQHVESECDEERRDASRSSEHASKCNCKKSRCLKLYCECFAALRYCDSCNCLECNNSAQHAQIRDGAVQLTKERNVAAFQIKVSSTVRPELICIAYFLFLQMLH